MAEIDSTSGVTAKKMLVGVIAVIAAAAAIAIGTSLAGGESPRSAGDSRSEYRPVSVVGAPLPPLGRSGVDAAAGELAPVLSGKTFSGSSVTIDPARDGVPTMVVFLAHWCPHCNSEIPVLREWLDSGLVPDGLRVVGVTTASRADQPNWPPSRWIEEKGWPWEVLVDSEQQTAAVAYGVDGFPFMVIVDENGVVKKRWSGEQGLEMITRLVNDAVGR